MDFLGMGFGEIVLILVLALILFGPDKIVGIARGLGKLAYNFKRVTSELTAQITKEVQEQEKNISQEASKTTMDIKQHATSSIEQTKQIAEEIRNLETEFKNDKSFSGN